MAQIKNMGPDKRFNQLRYLWQEYQKRLVRVTYQHVSGMDYSYIEGHIVSVAQPVTGSQSTVLVIRDRWNYDRALSATTIIKIDPVKTG